MTNQNQIKITLTDKELEMINKYAEEREIKKATAVKELAMRGLEVSNPFINKTIFTSDFIKKDNKYLQEDIDKLKEFFQKPLDYSITDTTYTIKSVREISYEEKLNLIEEKINTILELLTPPEFKINNTISFPENSDIDTAIEQLNTLMDKMKNKVKPLKINI